VSLRDPSDLNVRWVDVRGRVVGEENLGRLPGGVRQLTLDARDRNGEILARGVYWLVARAGPHRDVVRVTWLR
jgi:flagellar hook assembly protein FlgD